MEQGAEVGGAGRGGAGDDRHPALQLRLLARKVLPVLPERGLARKRGGRGWMVQPPAISRSTGS